MSLIAKLKRFFDAGVVTRGRSYFASGRVRKVRSDRHTYEAKVRGPNDYSVELMRDGTTLVARCECPYYADNLDLCKHVVAAILSAEAAGEPVVAGDVRSVDVVDEDLPEDYGWDEDDRDDEEDWDEDDYEDEDDEDEWEDETPPSARTRGWR